MRSVWVLTLLILHPQAAEQDPARSVAKVENGLRIFFCYDAADMVHPDTANLSLKEGHGLTAMDKVRAPGAFSFYRNAGFLSERTPWVSFESEQRPALPNPFPSVT